MALTSRAINATTEFNAPMATHELGVLAYDDRAAHTITVLCVQDGEPVQLAGAGVTGYVLRADRTTVVISGTASGSNAIVTLPEAAYAVSGAVQIAVRVTTNTIKNTVYLATGSVIRTRSDVTVDPGSVVPSLDELLAIIDQAEEAAVNAQAAVSMIAGTYAPPYNPGYYMMRSGTLYRSIFYIPATEAFTAAHWTATTATHEIWQNRIELEHHTGAVAIQRSSGTGYNYAMLAIAPGDRLRIENETDGTLLVESFDTATNAAVETLHPAVSVRGTVIVEASEDADALRVYFNSAGTVYAERMTSRLSVAESNAAAAEPVAVNPKNLLDAANAFTGQYYSAGTGEHTTDTGFRSFAPIRVEPSTDYCLSWSGDTIYFATLCELDADRDLVSGSYNATAQFTTSASTRWLLVSVYVGNMDGIQLEAGTARTAYEPYHEPRKVSQIRIDLDEYIGLKGLKFCAFGDSVASADDGSRGANTWIQRIADRFGGTAYNRGIGGSCVTNQTSAGVTRSGTSFVDAAGDAGPVRKVYTERPSDLGAYTTEINPCMNQAMRTATVPTDTDIVVIIAGINDIGSVTHEGFRAAYTTMLANLMTRVPNAAIYPCALPYQQTYDGGADADRAEYEAFRDDIRACAERFGFPVIELKKLMGVNGWNHGDFMNDVTHYNTEAGRRRTAEVIGKFIAEHYARY